MTLLLAFLIGLFNGLRSLTAPAGDRVGGTSRLAEN